VTRPIHLLQFAPHRCGVPGTIHGVPRQHSLHQEPELRDLRDLEDRRTAGVSRALLVREGKVSGEHLEEEHSQGKHVGALVLRCASPLFRCHVRRRSTLDASLPKGPGQAEVEDLGVPSLPDEDVRRLEIAVHDAGRVCMRQG
jgi:hypothetical protein